MDKKKVLAISGSTKQHSSSASILRYIAREYAEAFVIDIFDGIDKLPHFNPDLDHENPPASVRDFRQRIASAHAVIICTPEYVFSLPGSLKNAIEWNVSTTLFTDKPVAIIVAAASGDNAFGSLNVIMSTLGARIKESSKLLIKGAKGKITGDGRLVDQGLKAQIGALAESLTD